MEDKEIFASIVPDRDMEALCRVARAADKLLKDIECGVDFDLATALWKALEALPEHLRSE